MTCSELIDRLNAIMNKYGDLPVGGGYMGDDAPLRRAVVVNALGIEEKYYHNKGEFIAKEVFLES